MTKEELATERNEVREILEGFSEELSQSNLDKLSRVFCVINGDEKRIAELEAENEQIKNSDTLCKLIGKQKRKIAELEDELKKWKDEWQEQVQKATDEGYARTLQTIQLNNAKEIIKQLLLLPYANNEEVFADVTSILDKAEQFLKNCEVEKC